jgi:hypothetical protein
VTHFKGGAGERKILEERVRQRRVEETALLSGGREGRSCRAHWTVERYMKNFSRET